MKTTASEQQLQQALQVVNKQFDGNIKFKRFDRSGKWINFTLTVKDSKAKGGRRSHIGRRIAAACWHVHGYYFDHLLDINPETVIKTAIGKIDQTGGNWQDKQTGSLALPMYYSEACDC